MKATLRVPGINPQKAHTPFELSLRILTSLFRELRSQDLPGERTLSPRRVYMSRATFDLLRSTSGIHPYSVTAFRVQCFGRMGNVCGFFVYEDQSDYADVHIQYCKVDSNHYGYIPECNVGY